MGNGTIKKLGRQGTQTIMEQLVTQIFTVNITMKGFVKIT